VKIELSYRIAGPEVDVAAQLARLGRRSGVFLPAYRSFELGLVCL
jgi:hypothetical protein